MTYADEGNADQQRVVANSKGYRLMTESGEATIWDDRFTNGGRVIATGDTETMRALFIAFVLERA